MIFQAATSTPCNIDGGYVINSNHTTHLSSLAESLEADERIQELRAKMAFLQTPDIDHNTLNALCSDTPFPANRYGSEIAIKPFKRAGLRFYDGKLRTLAQELAHSC